MAHPGAGLGLALALRTTSEMFYKTQTSLPVRIQGLNKKSMR